MRIRGIEIVALQSRFVGATRRGRTLEEEGRRPMSIARGASRRGVCLAALCAVTLCSAEARADDPSPPPKREYRVGLFESLGTNMLDSVSGYNVMLHGVAIASTVALSASGTDDRIQRWFWRDNTILGETIPDLAFIGGWLTPALIPGAVALTGIAAEDVTALQAVGINAVFTSSRR
jgi:hypothetical protein